MSSLRFTEKGFQEDRLMVKFPSSVLLVEIFFCRTDSDTKFRAIPIFFVFFFVYIMHTSSVPRLSLSSALGGLTG
jgi:hypothetical protein